jgi:hypothetical protein
MSNKPQYPTAEEELKTMTKRFWAQVEVTEKTIKERDALAEALGPFVTLNPLSKRVQERWHGYLLNAKQALAATKGGSHE